MASKAKTFQPPPPSMTLEEELAAVWRKPLHMLPVAKDLPRLANRVEVIINDKPALNIAGTTPDAAPVPLASAAVPAPVELPKKNLMANKVDYRLSRIMDRSGVAESFRFKDEDALIREESYIVWICKSLPADALAKRRATGIWPAWDGPGFLSVRQKLKNVHVELKLKDAATALYSGHDWQVVDMEDSTRYFALGFKGGSQWIGIAFHNRPDAADFKEVLEDKNNEAAKAAAVAAAVNTAAAPDRQLLSPRKDQDESLENSYQAIRKCVLGVADALETPEVAGRFRSTLDRMGKDISGDLEMFTNEMWHAASIDQDGKTARVFKAIHQNIVFVAIYHLKLALQGLMTRDVRGPEGWRVFVHILPDVVVITHIRREQALATQPPEEYFWYEWQLRLIFDSKMSVLRASRLRLDGIGFGPQTSAASKDKYNRLFGGGNLIIA